MSATAAIAPDLSETAPATNPRIAAIEEQFGIDFRSLNVELETASAEERVAWTLRTFPGHVALSSSFGAQAAVSLHMATAQQPDIPVVLADTGYLFAETYQFIEELTARLDLNLHVYRSQRSASWQEAIDGKRWEDGVEGIEAYNRENKVEPMNRALEELDAHAMLAGLRRQQSSTREKLPVLAAKDGRVKVHPLIDWTDRDVFNYLKKHDLPYHPLWEAGYVSIGDWHTSSKLTDGMSAEDTRFNGLKRECGLHEDVDTVDFVI